MDSVSLHDSENTLRLPGEKSGPVSGFSGPYDKYLSSFGVYAVWITEKVKSLHHGGV
jgi:hypothetical protein